MFQSVSSTQLQAQLNVCTIITFAVLQLEPIQISNIVIRSCEAGPGLFLLSCCPGMYRESIGPIFMQVCHLILTESLAQ